MSVEKRTLVHFFVPFPQGWYIPFLPHQQMIAMTPSPPENAAVVTSLFGPLKSMTTRNNQLVVMEFLDCKLDETTRKDLSEIGLQFQTPIHFQVCENGNCAKKWEELTGERH